MNDKNKYLDPATNPMIRPLPDGWISPESDEPSLPFEEPRIPLGGYMEKKAEGAAENKSKPRTDEEALAGISQNSLRELMGAEQTLHLYDSPFYDLQTPKETMAAMRPVVTLEKVGLDVRVVRPDSAADVLTAGEADLIRAAMKRKAG